MPFTPFYFEAKENLKDVVVVLSEKKETQRQQDKEIVFGVDDYYAPHRARWLRNAAVFNLIQTGTDDVISNWYLGWARILINHCLATMSQGVPEADFEPVGPSDHKKRFLWNSIVKHAISMCNWRSHQRPWLLDNMIFGTGATRVFSEIPMRHVRSPRDDGSFATRFIRDMRRAKVGIRRRSVFRCMRSHLIADPEEVRVGIEKEILPHNAYVLRYANARYPNGEKIYDTDQVPTGSHYLIWHLEFEDEDAKRIYVVPYGGKPESTYEKCPERELGYPIYDDTLTRYNMTVNGVTVLHGDNALGLSSLTFSTFDARLDDDGQTYSTVGMGIPDLIAGPEALMQALVNMTIDNVRLKNTVPISVENAGQISPDGFNIDITQMYSGLLMNAKVTPQPLGIADVSSNSVMWEWLKQLIYQLSGINPDQITGDNLKTAFQSGLIVRQMNMRAQDRITAWENGPFKRMFRLLLAKCLSDLTVADWEEITEKDAQEIMDRIGSDEMSGEDFSKEEVTNEDGSTGKVYKRRVMFYFPVRGRKFREDFTGKNKKRTLDAYSTENTLIEDPSMKEGTSHLPAVPEYLDPSGGVISILQFDIRVEAKSMLMDLKTQDSQNAEKFLRLGVELKQAIPEIDLKKQYVAAGKISGFEEEDMLVTDAEQSKLGDSVSKTLAAMKALNTPQPNAPGSPAQQTPPVAPAPGSPSPQPVGLSDQQTQPAGAANVVQQLASRAV